jgi:hypothetical protein
MHAADLPTEMLAQRTAPSRGRGFRMGRDDIDYILHQFGVEKPSPEVEQAAGPVIALAGALVAMNRNAADTAIEELRRIPAQPDVLDFVASLSLVLFKHTPIVSSCLQQRAPGFGRLSHPAGAHALFEGTLDLFSA